VVPRIFCPLNVLITILFALLMLFRCASEKHWGIRIPMPGAADLAGTTFEMILISNMCGMFICYGRCLMFQRVRGWILDQTAPTVLG